MRDAGRPTGIGRRRKRVTAGPGGVVADDQLTGQQVHLLPMVMHERGGGVDARIEAQQPGAASHLAGLVEIAGEDLLLDAGGIARRGRPSLRQIDPVKLKMRLVHRHQ